MGYAAFFLASILAMASAQFGSLPMWGGMNNQMMSTWKSQGNMMPWPTPGIATGMGMWRSHPLMRMAASAAGSPATGNPTASVPAGASVSAAEKLPLLALPQNIINVPKVPSSEEILTHMVLVNPNPKPYVDHISDLLYSPDLPKARAVMTPIYVTGMTALPGMYATSEMRNSGNMMDDCTPQETARWNRDMSEWVY